MPHITLLLNIELEVLVQTIRKEKETAFQYWQVRSKTHYICHYFQMFRNIYKKQNSLAVQWLGLHAFTAVGPGSIPGQGT